MLPIPILGLEQTNSSRWQTQPVTPVVLKPWSKYTTESQRLTGHFTYIERGRTNSPFVPLKVEIERSNGALQIGNQRNGYPKSRASGLGKSAGNRCLSGSWTYFCKFADWGGTAPGRRRLSLGLDDGKVPVIHNCYLCAIESGPNVGLKHVAVLTRMVLTR